MATKKVVAKKATKKVVAKKVAAAKGPYDHMLNQSVIVRTVTMIYTGILIAVFDQELLVGEAAWIADTERYHEAVTKAEFREVEPFGDDPIVVGRGAIVDVAILGRPHPREQK